MSFFDSIKEMANGLVNEVKKFNNKTFLEAIMAGSALVAMADGTISPEEKRKFLGFARDNEALKVFDFSEVQSTFEKYVSAIEKDSIMGEGECLAAIGKMKKDPDGAKILVRLCMSIGASDGNFDDKEKEIVRMICAELDLAPATFRL